MFRSFLTLIICNKELKVMTKKDEFINPEIEGLTPEAQFAVRLSQAGCTEAALGFMVAKLSGDGYESRLEDLHLGIQRWKEQTPQCFKQGVQAGNAPMMDALRERMAQRA